MNENEIKNYRPNKVTRCLSSNQIDENLIKDLKNIKNTSDIKENNDKKEEKDQTPSANPESKPISKLNINAAPYNKSQTNKTGLNIHSKEFYPKRFDKIEPKVPQNSLSNNNLSYNPYNKLNPPTFNNATQFHAKNDYSGHTYTIKDNNNLQSSMPMNNSINTAQGPNIYNQYIPPYSNQGNNYYNPQAKTMPNNFYMNSINTNYPRPPNPTNPNLAFYNNSQPQNYNNNFAPGYNNFNKVPNMNLAGPNNNMNMPKPMSTGGLILEKFTQKPISNLNNYPHILNSGPKPEIKNENNNNININNNINNNNNKPENDKNNSTFKPLQKLNKNAKIFIPGVKKIENEGKEKNDIEENKEKNDLEKNKENIIKETKENINKEIKENKSTKENKGEEIKTNSLKEAEKPKKEIEEVTKEVLVPKIDELKNNKEKSTKPETLDKNTKEEHKEIIKEKEPKKDKEEIKPSTDTNNNNTKINNTPNTNKINNNLKEATVQPVNNNNKVAPSQNTVQEKTTPAPAPKPEPKRRGLAELLSESPSVNEKKTTKTKRRNPPQNISQQPPKEDEFSKKLKMVEESLRDEKIRKMQIEKEKMEEKKRQKEIELKEKEEKRLEDLRIKKEKEEEEKRLEDLRIKKEKEEAERLEKLRIQKEEEERLEKLRIQKEKEEEEKRKELEELNRTIIKQFYFIVPAHPEHFKKEEKKIKKFDLEYLTSFRNWNICKNETKLIDENVMKHIKSFEIKVTETKAEILNQINRSNNNNYKDYKKKDGGFRKGKDFPRKKESQNLLVVPTPEGGNNEGTNLSQWGRKDLTNEIKLAEEFKKNLDEIKKRDPVKFDLTEFLNMLTLDNYDDTKKLIFDLIKDKVEYQNKFLEVLFQKAIVEKSYVTLYAKLCKELDKELPQKHEPKVTSLKDKLEEGNTKRRERSVMRKNLLDKCRKIFMVENNEEFDKFVKSDDPDEKEQKKKKFILGNVNFIAELINVQILSKKIVFQCIDNLFKRFDKESTIQSLKFIDLEAIVILTDKFGTLVNKTKEKIVEKDLDDFTGKIEDYIERLKKSENEPNLPGYIKYKIINLIAKKNNGWKETQYEKNIGAKSKAEVKKAYEESQKKFTPESSNINSSSKKTYTQDEITEKIGNDLINFKDEVESGEKISSYKWEIISDLYSHNIKLDQMLEGFIESCLDFVTEDEKKEYAISYWTEVFSYYINEMSSGDCKKLRDKTIELFSYASSLITENKLLIDIWVTVLMEMNKSGNLHYSDLDENKDNAYKEDLENIFLVFKHIIEKEKEVNSNADEIYDISYVKNNMDLFNKIMQS